MKSKWIPKKLFFQLRKEGKLPPELQAKYNNTTKTKKVKKRKVRKTRRTKSKKANKNKKATKSRGPEKLKQFIIYVKGEEMETVSDYSSSAAEKKAKAKYNTKNICTGEIK